MKTQTLLSMLMILLSFNLFATHPITTNVTDVVGYDLISSQEPIENQLNEYLSLTPKQIEAKLGKKLTLGEKFSLKINQVKSKIILAMSPGSSGKNQLTALLLVIFLGYLGVHRFYLGYPGLGILELLTGGLFGVLWLVDLIRIATGELGPKNGRYGKTLGDY